MLLFIVYIRGKGLYHLHQLEGTAIRKGRGEMERRMGERKGNSFVETILYLLQEYYRANVFFKFCVVWYDFIKPT